MDRCAPSSIPTTRFSHHPSTSMVLSVFRADQPSASDRAGRRPGAGTCRESLRLPDGDAAASYTSDHTVELASVVPAPQVGFRTTHVDMHGITRPGKHHEKRRIDAPWAFTGDRTRLAVRDLKLRANIVHTIVVVLALGRPITDH